jgi:hypothetical protein
MKTTHRRGAILAVALVTLLVVGLLAGLVLQRSLSAHRQLRLHGLQLQAEALAEAAVARGIAMRRADAEYTGETWQVSQENLPEKGAATIRVEAAADKPGHIQITVEARYPDDSLQRARVERTYLLPLAPAAEPAP